MEKRNTGTTQKRPADCQVSFVMGDMAMTKQQERQLRQWVAEGKEQRFYTMAAWKHAREATLRLDRYECQKCKARGRYTKAVLVHHVKHLKDQPELALSLYDPETGKRQLISLCKRCHEEEHPDSQTPFACRNEPVTQERWD